MDEINEEEGNKRSENIDSIKNETKGFYFRFVKMTYSSRNDIDRNHWTFGFNNIVKKLSTLTNKVKKEDFIKAMFEVIDSARTIYQLGDFKRYPVENYDFQKIPKQEIDSEIKKYIVSMVENFYKPSIKTNYFPY